MLTLVPLHGQVPTRISKHYPGRIVFVMVNLAIALALMEGNMFAVLGKILGSIQTLRLLVVVATDISINKYVLKLSPKEPEYRRDMLYNVNPVGMVAFLVSAGLSIAAFFGLLGSFWLLTHRLSHLYLPLY